MKRFTITLALALVASLPLAHTHAQHVTSGVIAEYDFEENGGTTVTDISGVGPALDLTIQDDTRVTWSPGYLSVDLATVIANTGPATKINDAIALGGAPTNEISIEALIKPANNTQGGAARIVNIGTFSSITGPTNRNVFLAQDKTNYDARLRTEDTGNNGSSPQQQTDPNSPIADVPELQHVLFTRDAAGVSKIYVNGVDISDPTRTQTGLMTNWDDTYGLSLANEQVWVSGQEGVRDFVGEFHHVTIYSRALTGAEVLQNAESFGIPEPTSLLMAVLGLGLCGATGRRRFFA